MFEKADDKSLLKIKIIHELIAKTGAALLESAEIKNILRETFNSELDEKGARARTCISGRERDVVREREREPRNKKKGVR